MAIDTQRVSLDISKQPALQVVRLGQGDENGTELVATVYDEGQAYDLTGKAVRLRIQLPGGYAEYHVDGTVSGNEATFAIDEAYAASVAGITDNAYVEVLQGDTVVCSTSRFRVVILPSAYEGTDPAHIWDNGVNAFLQSANAQVRELTQDATEAINAAANAESSAAAELDAALDALGDISEIAVPLMSTTTRGGAMLGSGLAVTEGKLHTQLVQGGQGIANTPMSADGDLLHGATVDGMSVQDGTPTPSAPVPVQVVETANLQPWPTSGTYSSGGASIAYGSDGDVITVASSTTANVWGLTESLRSTNLIHLMPGTYVVTCPDNLRLMVRSYDSETNTWTNIAANSRSPYTLTLQEASDIICMYSVPNGTGAGTYEGWVMVNDGTTPQPYIPYGNLGLVVKGRNLLNTSRYAPTSTTAISDFTAWEAEETNTSSNGDTAWTRHADGSITVVGENIASNSTRYFPLDNMLPSGTTVSLKGIEANGNTGQFQFMLTSPANHSTLKTQDGTFTLTEDVDRLGLRLLSGGRINGRFAVTLEISSELHEFTPYLNEVIPIPLNGNFLMSLPDGTRDTLVIDELGNMKLVKRVNVATFDGDESWNVQSNGNRVATTAETMQAIGAARVNISSGNGRCILCDKFVGNGASALANATVGVGINNAVFSGTNIAPILFSDGNGGMTAEAWSTWLQSNPVTVYYPLATPQVIDLGTIDLPKLADGATLEVLANLDTGVSADWWAVGAGAVGDGLLALRDLLGAGE